MIRVPLKLIGTSFVLCSSSQFQCTAQRILYYSFDLLLQWPQKKSRVHLWPFTVLRYRENPAFPAPGYRMGNFTVCFNPSRANHQMRRFISWGLASAKNHYGKWNMTSIWDSWKSPEEGETRVSPHSWCSPLLSLFLTSLWGCFIQTDIGILSPTHQVSFFMSPLRV